MKYCDTDSHIILDFGLEMGLVRLSLVNPSVRFFFKIGFRLTY